MDEKAAKQGKRICHSKTNTHARTHTDKVELAKCDVTNDCCLVSSATMGIVTIVCLCCVF